MKKTEILLQKIREAEKPVLINYNKKYDVMDEKEFKEKMKGEAYMIAAYWNRRMKQIQENDDKEALNILKNIIDESINFFKEYEELGVKF